MAGNVAADLVVHVGADTKDAESGLNSIGSKVDNTGKGFKTAGLAMMGIGAAAIGGLGLAVNSAMNFEQSIADINAVTDLTTAQMSSVKDLALQIGKDTAFSATEGAQAIGELAKAGVPVEDILNGAAMSAANLASAGGIGIPEAAVAMSNAMNMFGISGENASQVADSFAAAANASAADVSSLTAAMAQGGPQAAAMGMSLNETNAALALFSNYGIQGSDAGTSLKTMLQRLAAPTEESAALMGELGISAFDASGNFVGMESLAGQLKTALSGMTEEQRNAALATIFGADASRVANVLYQEGAEGVRAMTDEVSKQGVAQQMAAARMNTLKGAIEQLKGSFETALIIIGSAFIPVLRTVADAVNGLMDKFLGLSPSIQKIVGIAIAAGGGLMILAGALAYAASFLPVLAVGFGILLSPIMLVVAAVALLAAAFATDFMGIRSKVMGTLGPVVDGIKSLGKYIGALASGDIMKIGKAFGQLPKSLKPFGQALFTTSVGIRKFIDDVKKDGLISAVKSIPDTFGPAIDSFKKFGDQVLSAIGNVNWGAIGSRIVSGLGNLASAVAGWIASNAPGIASAIGNGLQAAASAAGDIASKIADGLGDLASAVGSWITSNAPGIGEAIRSGLETAASTAVDIAGTIVSKLGDLAGRFAEWVSTAAAGVNWGALADGAYDIASTIIGKLGDLASRFKEWVTGGGATADWTQLYSTVTDITASVVEKLGNLGEALKTWVDNAGITSGISNLASTLIGKVTNATPSIVGKLGDLGVELLNWYNGAIDSVNWAGMGEDIGSKVGDLIGTLWQKGTQLINGFRMSIQENWKTIGTALVVLVASLPATIGYLGATLGPKALEFLQGFVDGLNINWGIVIGWGIGFPMKVGEAIGSLMETLAPKAVQLLSGFVTSLTAQWPTVTAWLGTVPGLIEAAVTSLLETLKPRGIELITGFLSAITTLWPTVTAWLGTVSDKAFNAVGSLSDTLLERGNELISGFYKAIGDKWTNTVAPWLMLVGQMAMQTIGSLGSTLLSRGIELIGGFWLGMIQKFTAVTAWIQAIPNSILGALGDLGGLLYAAGAAIVQGLIDGLGSMVDALAGAAGGLKDTILQHKGPMSYDKVMLVPAGKAIVNSLIIGMESKEDELYRLADSMTNRLSNTGASLAASLNADMNEFNRLPLSQFDRNTTVNQTIHIDAHFDDVEDMVRAAKFVREINPARTLYTEVLR